ncbi:hypothetical protein EMPS_10269 [Entomortierella parvispora]|uniref:Homologous recombination OB-fold protein OB-fold domain-containing protein n=1 Tax=Entomortierella parvispora TaxID=205924 RepID=A0A9P3HJL5_9FUNG|nr:hypothetical protein EMPS_10269 [Entomortierella parvispora]
MFKGLSSKLGGGTIPQTVKQRDPVAITNNNSNSNSGSNNNNSNKNNTGYTNDNHGYSYSDIGHSTSNGTGSSNSSRATTPNASAGTSSHSTMNHSNRTTPELNGGVPRPVFKSGSGLLRSFSSPSSGIATRSGEEVTRKRRLPGPAGNLPRLSAEEKDRLFRSKGKPFGGDVVPDPNSTSPSSSIKKKMKAVAPGPVDSMFVTGAWQDMMRTMGLPDYKPSTLRECKHLSPWTALSISDIEHNKDLHRGKIQNIVVMIKDVSLSEIDTAATLLDPSGEMPGTIHRSVLDQYKNNEIRTGTVLALKNVSVFSLQVSHYLMIMPKNIEKLFQPHPPTITLSQGSSQDRASQRRQKIRSSQSQEDSASPSGTRAESGTFSSQESSSLLRQSSLPPNRKHAILSPEWPEDDLSQLKTGSQSQSTLDLLNLSMEDEGLLAIKSESSIQSPTYSDRPSQEGVPAKKQKLGSTSRNSPASSQPLSPNQEVQFQSLRQTLSGSNPYARATTRQDDLPYTPMNLLGPSTPALPMGPPTHKSTGAGTGAGAGAGGGILSAFAASADLRKRSSPSSVSQRSSSSGSTTTPSLPTASAARFSSVADMSMASISNPNVSSQGETGRPLSQSEQLSSSDWLDEFSGVDFDGALDDLDSSPTLPRPGTSTAQMTSSLPENPQPLLPTHLSNHGSNAPAVTANPPSSIYRQASTVDVDDDDDLYNLLDGLDESELYDL